jgi:predicted nucleic acid-binding protein
MKYLVDANVSSEPTRPVPNVRVVAWLQAHEQDMASIQSSLARCD